MSIRKILSVSCLVCALLLTQSSCKKDEAPTVTTVNYSLPIANISGSYNNSFTYTVSSADLSQAFATMGLEYNVNKVKSAKLTALQAVDDNSFFGFDNVNQISVYIKLNGSAGNGVEIARGVGGSSANSVNLVPVPSVDLKPYIVSPLSVLTVVVTTIDASFNNPYFFSIRNGNVEVTAEK